MKNIQEMVIPFLAGDGIGSEIMAATQMVVEQAVRCSYGDKRKIRWLECPAGERAYQACGEWLPQETLQTLGRFPASIKGPLTTPVGGGIRSLNVSLRQDLDLYVCLRPVRWFEGLPSPHRNPVGMDLVIFRENTEDIYTGIEFAVGSPQQKKWLAGFQREMPEYFEKIKNAHESGIGIKPISKTNSQRLVRAAVDWALENTRKRLTLVHKGNIMKFTEGAFRNWGYELVDVEFPTKTFSANRFSAIVREEGAEAAERAKSEALHQDRLWVDDVIADVVFEQLITCPQNFDVIATTNLNGDYISDAAAALAGGVGISPGANINFEKGIGIFEANHGSANNLAGQNKANPSSLMLSAEMMLRFMQWEEAAEVLRQALEKTIRAGQVTFDLAAQIEEARILGTKEFAQAIHANMQGER